MTLKKLTLLILGMIVITSCSKDEEPNTLTITGGWGTQIVGDLAESTGIDYYGIDFGDRIRTFFAVEGDTCGTFDSYLTETSATETTMTLSDGNGGTMVINYVSESEFSFSYTVNGAVVAGNFVATSFLICE